MISHELLEDVHVNTVSHVEECTVFYVTFLPISKHVHIDIKVQVQVACRRLHPPHVARTVECRATALALETWRAQLETYHPTGPREMPRDHALDRKLRTG